MRLENYSVVSPFDRNKERGAYFTPEGVARALVSWVVRKPSDRLLDPSCGDGRFLTLHNNSVGVERDPLTAVAAHRTAPHAMVHVTDFFAWASQTPSRFDCVAGNPPFIRYQKFNGDTRKSALSLCGRAGAELSALTSSWAPFVICSATLLRPGGRLAFVVPAEIGHATYARPLLQYLLDNFSLVQVIAVREKLFPDLSEDAWLLYCEGFGRSCEQLSFSRVDRFDMEAKLRPNAELISRGELETWGFRLRPFLLPSPLRSVYEHSRVSGAAVQLGSVAKVGIGYVSGANDFFHFRPSVAKLLQIPEHYLAVSVRNGRMLSGPVLNRSIVEEWLAKDEQVLLLKIGSNDEVPLKLRTYLDSPEGLQVRTGFKCRNRSPWYSVPDVLFPDAFLTYMNGRSASIVQNKARCTCTNSLHAIRLIHKQWSVPRLQRSWNSHLSQLSCELEGHPLGGGMLKLEPREASRVLLPLNGSVSDRESAAILEGINLMRSWRHLRE